MKKILIFLVCFMLSVTFVTADELELVGEIFVEDDVLSETDNNNLSVITDEMTNNHADLTSKINDLYSQILNLQKGLDGTFSGKSITLTNLKPNTKLHINLNGETSEFGEGKKTPDNPYILSGVERSVITVSDGVDTIEYPIVVPQSLYSLPDGTCDFIEINNVAKTARFYRNIGEFILTGSENWQNGTTGVPDMRRFRYTGIQDLPLSSKLHCTHYSNDFTFAEMYYDENALGIVVHSTVSAIEVFDPNAKDATEFKAFLAARYAAGTPVKILYKFATPIISELDYEVVKAYFPTTIISVDEGTLDVKLLLPTIVVDDDIIYVLTFCLYLFCCLMVAFMALRFVFGLCRTGLDVLSWLPFRNVKLFKFKERRRIYKDD